MVRKQMVAILYRYTEYKNESVKGVSCPDSFTDRRSVGNYAVPTLDRSVDNGFIYGITDTILSSQGNVTRVRIEAITVRYLNKY